MRTEPQIYELPVIELLLDPNARVIPLPQGKYAIVDSADWEVLSRDKWQLHRDYASRVKTVNYKRTVILMHRIVADTPVGLQTDHINRIPLDNRRSNLRHCAHFENLRNTIRYRNNKTGIKGVSFSAKRGKYQADVRYNGSRTWLGYFNTAVEAGEAYAKEARLRHGEFTRIH